MALAVVVPVFHLLLQMTTETGRYSTALRETFARLQSSALSSESHSQDWPRLPTRNEMYQLRTFVSQGKDQYISFAFAHLFPFFVNAVTHYPRFVPRYLPCQLYAS